MEINSQLREHKVLALIWETIEDVVDSSMSQRKIPHRLFASRG